jgi:molecular chaperone GrpE
MTDKKHHSEHDHHKNHKHSEEDVSEENHDVAEQDTKISELNDKYLRLYSDFENFRRRSQKEKYELVQNANEHLLLELLPVYDDFERALENIEKNSLDEVLVEGMRHIFNKLTRVLDNAGLKEIEAKGEKFDPELHEAIAKIPAGKDSMKGKIVDQAQKGYKLNDKIIRHAKVVVGE